MVYAARLMRGWIAPVVIGLSVLLLVLREATVGRSAAQPGSATRSSEEGSVAGSSVLAQRLCGQAYKFCSPGTAPGPVGRGNTTSADWQCGWACFSRPAFGSAVPTLVQLLHRLRNGQPLRITTLGGSASASKVNYAGHVAAGLCRVLQPSSDCQQQVQLFNPSQGSTSTVWASLFMESIVTPSTDILIWEFSINDWTIGDVNDKISATERTRQYLRLFVRRALALNPRVCIVFLFLWEYGAARCFPDCEDSRVQYEAAVQLLREDQQLAGATAFAFDFEQYAREAGYTKDELFKDHHHLSAQGHYQA